MMLEDDVVECVSEWLKTRGCRVDKTCKGTARGDDISAVCSDGMNLYVECKGSVSKRGNELDSWLNSAMAVFGAIKDTEEKRPNSLHAIAVPDTVQYQKALDPLNGFFVRQRISVFFVQSNGEVREAGAPNKLLHATCEDARA